MGASDYMVGNAPGGMSYGAGNMAQQLYQMIGGLPQDYMQGTQNARTLNLQKPILGPDGQPTTDIGAITNELLKRGGAEYAKELAPLIYQRQQQADFYSNLNGGQGGQGGAQPQANTGPNTSPVGQSPDMLRRASEGQGQPSLSSTGSDSAGAETVRSLTAGIGGGRDVPGNVISNYARALGVDPDAPLSAEQEARARKIIGNNLAGRGAGRPTDTLSSPDANETTPVGTGGMPSAPGQGGGQISPSPQGAPGPGAPPGGAGAQPAPGPRPQGIPIPPGIQRIIGNPQTADEHDAAAKKLLKLGAAPGISPQQAAAVKALGEQEAGIAKQMREVEGKIQEKVDPRVIEANKIEAQNKDDTTRYGKQLSSIQGSAQAGNRMLEHIQLAEGLYKNPNFYSGAGEGLNLMYKRVVNALNPNNTESLPQEAFRKTMAASVLNQVEQLKDDTAAVGGGGRLFQAQIELMEKAANNPDNSIPANRLLTEIAKRGALESKHIAQMANSYKGGHLDAEFAQKIDDYYTQHPMFSAAEMKDIRLIAPPVAPKLDSKEQAVAWAHKAGLKPGDPMKLPSGRIVPAP
jgi:hypothetical protein